jgi:hypothetical protein
MNMIKSKLITKKSGLSEKKVEMERKGINKKTKPYPIPEEDSFIPLQEDSEEIKYTTKKTYLSF